MNCYFCPLPVDISGTTPFSGGGWYSCAGGVVRLGWAGGRIAPAAAVCSLHSTLVVRRDDDGRPWTLADVADNLCALAYGLHRFHGISASHVAAAVADGAAPLDLGLAGESQIAAWWRDNAAAVAYLAQELGAAK